METSSTARANFASPPPLKIPVIQELFMALTGETMAKIMKIVTAAFFTFSETLNKDKIGFEKSKLMRPSKDLK